MMGIRIVKKVSQENLEILETKKLHRLKTPPQNAAGGE